MFPDERGFFSESYNKTEWAEKIGYTEDLQQVWFELQFFAKTFIFSFSRITTRSPIMAFSVVFIPNHTWEN